jgi:hypothetical protein
VFSLAEARHRRLRRLAALGRLDPGGYSKAPVSSSGMMPSSAQRKD